MSTVPYREKTSVMSLLTDRMAKRGVPLTAMIEIADRCNEVCVHCYQVQGQKGEMTTEQLFDVLDELARIGVLFLTISGGEATLRPDFLAIVRRARELGFAVKLYTNGLTMNAELADALAELALQEAQISIYSHRADVHDWVTRVPGSFERTTEAVRLLRARGVAVVVKTPLMSFNSDRSDRDAYVAMAESLGADFQFDPELTGREDDERAPEGFRLSDATLAELFADERLNAREADAARTTDPAPTHLGHESICGACSAAVHIEPNGEVRPCTSFTVPLGNATTDGVRAAFESSLVAEGIRGLTWGSTLGCAGCAINGHCHRCHANARREAGDARSPYASACRAARLRYAATIESEVTVDSDSELDPGVGPYAIVAPGRLRRLSYQPTEADHALGARLPFLRGQAQAEVPRIAAGELVQIRRPGKKPAVERVPGEKPIAT